MLSSSIQIQERKNIEKCFGGVNGQIVGRVEIRIKSKVD